MRGVIVAASVVMLALPLGTELVTNLAPRWPSPIGWSVVLGILCALTVWVGGRRAEVWVPETSRRRRFVFWCLGGAIICLVTYCAGDAIFCWCDPPARNYNSRVVAGFLWASDDIRTLAKTTSVIDLLRGSPWDPEQIWAPWSIAVVRLCLFLAWTLGWLFAGGGVSLLSADFVPARGKKRGQRTDTDDGLPPDDSDGPGQLDSNLLVILSDAIHDAFPTPQQLRQVLVSRLQDDIYNYAGMESEYPSIRFELVQSYNSKWKMENLINALRAENPTNIKLQEFQRLAFGDRREEQSQLHDRSDSTSGEIQ